MDPNNIGTLDQQEFVDIFAPKADPNNPAPPGATNVRFGSSEDDVDILANQNAGDTTTLAPDANADETTTKAPEGGDQDADILGKTKPGPKPKVELKDAAAYFEERINAGKYVAIEEVGEDGKKKPFIPRTADEIDEFVDIQVEHKLYEKTKELDQKWYSSKSPAWQVVAEYAEKLDDPTEILPFLQGVRTLSSVANLDDKDVSGAEQIVRTRLLQRGDDEDSIREQIDALKTADKLLSTAQKWKPQILQQEAQSLQQMKAQQDKKQQDYQRLVDTIRENAIKAIEAPIFGKQKLKQDEKAAIYELIAEPTPETKGYQIYNAIDSLFDKGDFDTLKQIALLLVKKDSLYGYVAAGAKDRTSETAQSSW
jgi:hypothetical protein